jgi:uncharacterized protein YunC (DUF1805 family)
LSSSLAWGAASLKLRKSHVVADGQQEVQMVISGATPAEVGEVKWNLPQGSVSPLVWMKDQLAYAYFKPSSSQGGSSIKIEGTLANGEKVRTELQLILPLKILTSLPHFTLGETKVMEVGVEYDDDAPFQEFMLKTTLGTLEEMPSGERWTLTLPDDIKKPSSGLLSLHFLTQPSMVLASRRIDVKANTQLKGEIEEDTELYVIIGRKTFGPYDAADGMPKLDIPPGISEVTFRAVDKAGNQTEVVKKVSVPPSWDAVLIPESFALPVGGLTTKIEITGLPEGLEREHLKANAELGSISDLIKNSAGRWSMTYASPDSVTGDVRDDRVSLVMTLEGKRSEAVLDMEILPGLLEKTEIDVLEVQRNDEGGVNLSYQMQMLDRDGRPLEELSFSLLSKLGSIGEIVESGNGHYNFTLSLPPGVEPDRVELDMNLKPEFYDVLSSQFKLWSPPGPDDPRCLVLATNDEGHPLGNVELLVNVEGGKKKIIRTSAMGIINVPFPENGPKMIRMTVEFKGFPATRREVLAPRPNLMPIWEEEMGQEALPPKVTSDLKVAIELESYPVIVDVPKEDGAIVEIEASKEPTELLLKLQKSRLLGDGQDVTKGTLVVLTESGLPVGGYEPTLEISKGTLTDLSPDGDGRFEFQLTSPELQASETLNLIANLREASLNTSIKVQMVVEGSTESLQAEEIILVAPTLAASATSVTYPDTVTLNIEQKDSNGAAAPDGTELSVSLSGEGGLDQSSVKTSAGKATVTYTPINKDGSGTVTVKSTGGTASVTLAATAKVDPDTKLGKPEISVSPVAVVYPATATITVDLKDEDGNAAPDGSVVRLTHDGDGALSSSEVKTSNGTGSVTYSPENKKVTVTFTASSDGGTSEASLDVEPPKMAAPEITASPSSVQFPNAVSIKVVQKYENGEAVPDGTSLSLSLEGSGSLDATSLSTSGGEASGTLTPENKTEEVTLTVNSEGGSASVVVSVTEEGVTCVESKISSASASAGEITYPETTTFSVELVCADTGEAFPDGEKVTFTWDGGSESVDSSGGKASFIYSSTNENKDLSFTISAASSSATETVKVTQKGVCPDYNFASATASPNEITFPATSSISVDLKCGDTGDAFGDGEKVTFTWDGGSETVSSSGGKATMTYQSTNEEKVITFTISGEKATATASVQLTQHAAPVGECVLSLSASPTEITHPATSTISVTMSCDDSVELSGNEKVTLLWDGSSEEVSLSGGKGTFTYESTNEDKTIEFTAYSESASNQPKVSVVQSATKCAEHELADAAASIAEITYSETSTISVKVTCADTKENVEDGTEVSFKWDGGSETAKTSGGQASIEYKSTNEEKTLTFTISTDSSTSDAKVSLIQHADCSEHTLTVSGASTEVNYPDTMDITATVKCKATGENIEDGTPVTFSWGNESETVTTSGGKAVLTYKSTNETKTVEMKVTSEPKEVVVATNIGGEASLSFSQKVCADVTALTTTVTEMCSGKTATISATVTCVAAKENAPDGTEVTFSWSGGTETVKTSAGKAEMTFAETAEGSYTIKASVASGSSTPSVTVKVLPSSQYDQLDWKQHPFDQTLRIGEDHEVSVQLAHSGTDCLLTEAVKVSFETTLGSLSSKTVDSDSTGLAKVTWSTGSTAGKGTFTATIDWNGESIKKTYDVLTGTFDRDKSKITITPDSIYGNGFDEAKVELEARDKFNNLITDQEFEYKILTVADYVGALNRTKDTSDGAGLSDVTYTSVLGGADSATSTGGEVKFSVFAKYDSSYTMEASLIQIKPTLSLSGSSTGTAGTAQDITVTILCGTTTDTKFSGSLPITFSGLSTQNGASATISHGGSTVNMGSSINVTFASGVATVQVTPVKVESASLTAVHTASKLNGSAAHAITVSAGALNSFSLQTVQVAGTSTVSLLATAFDANNNVIASHDPTQDITFSIATGTRSGQNITWSGLPAGGTDQRDGTAILSAASFGTFDTQGRILVGVSNTIAETNTFSVTQGSVSATSSSFTWSPNSGTQLVFGTKPTSSILQSTTWPTFTIRVLDDFGNLLSTDNGRTVSLTTVGGNGSITGTTATTVNGVATFSSTSGTSPGDHQFQGTSTGLRSTITWVTTILGGSATSLKLTSEPSSATAGTAVNYTVEVLNAGGTRVSNYTGTLNLTSTDGSATLGDLTFTTGDAGVKTFAVTYATAGSQSITLTDSASAAVKITSSTLTVSPGAVNKLSFVSQPSSAVVNTNMNSIVVHVQDANGNTVSTDASTVTLAKLSGAGTVSGTVSVAAVSGVATFSAVQHDTVESLTLRASATGITSGDSSAIVVANAGHYNFSIETPFTTLAPGSPSLVNVVKAVDANGAVVNTYTGTVQFSSTDTAATLPANYTFTAADLGVYSFTNEITFNTLGSQTFSVKDTAVASTLSTSSTFTIQASSKGRVKAQVDDQLVERWSTNRDRLYPRGYTWDTLQVDVVPSRKDTLLMSELRVLNGAQVIWQKRLNTKDGSTLTWIWDGLSSSGDMVDSGIYVLELVVTSEIGEITRLEKEIELDGNIDLGQYGP